MTYNLHSFGKILLTWLIILFSRHVQSQNLVATLDHTSRSNFETGQNNSQVYLTEIIADFAKKHKVKINYDYEILTDKKLAQSSVNNLQGSFEARLEQILKPFHLKLEKFGKDSYAIYPETNVRKELKKIEKSGIENENSDVLIPMKNLSIRSDDNIGKRNNVTLSGKVTSAENNEPLPGVTVILKGTSSGTVTDIGGTYSFTIDKPEGTLVFSYLGFVTQEVSIDGKSVINVILASDTKALEEVVVVGYGSQKKGDIAGSVASISSKDMRTLPTTRVDQALQGRSPGVVVQNNDASPNASVSIRIRGSNSLTGSNDPLIVINGFIGGDLNSINPNDIESTQVLKDASATAIYGSRGANGVILITTKKGSQGKAVIQYNNFLSFQSLRKKLDLLDAGEYSETVNANRRELGLGDAYTAEEVANFKANGGTDWQDQIFRKALQQNHQLSLSGGNSNVAYYLSGNYANNEGIIKGTSFKRYSIRSNIEAQATSKLKVGANLFLSNSIDHPTSLNSYVGGNDGSPVFAARLWAPTLPVYNSEGIYTKPSSLAGPKTIYNPLAMALEPIRDNKQNIIEFNTFAEYTLIKDLTLRITGAGRLNDDENSYFINTNATGVGASSAGITNKRYLVLQNTNQLNYHKTIASNHTIDLTAVYEMQSENYNSSFTGTQSLLTNSVTYYNLTVGNSLSNSVYSDEAIKKLESYVGRLNYSYQDKYSASFTARSDASSVFGKNNKRGFFPSAAVAWRLNNEAFLKNINQISNLKLRASYGITGNQGIKSYSSLNTLNTGAPYAITGSTLSTGVTLGTLPNSDLKWEKTAQLDLGIDLALFNGRVEFTADYYRKKTSDLLMDVPVPLTSGYKSVLKNIGEVENKGVELSLGGKPLDGDFTWSSNINLAINRNKVLALSGEKEIALGSPGLPNFGNTVFLQVGQPLGALKGYIQNGIWGTAEADQATKYESIPGAPKYIDQQNDGVIDDKDIVIMGTTFPKYTFGWTNTFSFKGFDLNILIQGTQGNKIYNLGRVYTDRFSSDADATSKEILNRWTPEHQNTDVPSFTGTNKYEKLQSNRWLEDGSYLRFKNITLGYNLPASMLKNIKINAVRLYVSGVNLITITEYTGYDPEARTGYDTSRTGLDPQARTGVDSWSGIDLATYPSQKSYTVGLNVTF